MNKPRHCCTDCNNDNHLPLCGHDESLIHNEPLHRFLRCAVSERCKKCYDAIDPMTILNTIEL